MVEEAPDATPCVVGIGASAGGLDPLVELIEALPVDTGACYVVIQHLSPDFVSHMPELLQRRTTMPVRLARSGDALVPNEVWLLPPGQTLILRDLKIELLPNISERRPHYVIDRFFESIAAAVGSRAIGVILSGTGSDGTRGARSINEAGGLMIAQDPSTAQFDGMPRSAIAAGMVDQVLSPRRIAQACQEYVPQLLGERALSDDERDHQDTVDQIVRFLRDEHSVDVSHYKGRTLQRRIERRAKIVGAESLSAYLERLRSDEGEPALLRRDVLISVTSFFRDPGVWDALSATVLPDVVDGLAKGEPVRAWVAGCSTGEEAYSLAIALAEAMAARGRDSGQKVFATDINEEALQVAAAGWYPAATLIDVGPERLATWFTREGDGYRVNRRLREMIIFAHHNLVKDAPFTRIHIATCRNVLIYVRPRLQIQVLRMLHFSLRHRGVLLLGKAETPGAFEQEFETLDRSGRIYRKSRDVRLPLFSMDTQADVSEQRSVIDRELRGAHTSGRYDLAAFGAHLKRRGGVCLYVSRDMSVFRLAGAVERFIRVPEGEITSDIRHLLPPGLALPITTALHRARSGREEVFYPRLRVDTADETLWVDVSVSYHPADGANAAFVSVVIEPVSTPSGASPTGDPRPDGQLRQLEADLQLTRENLQSIIEELEATNEEAQATNEELMASNEELQSTNEELHSVNEELHTVNTEYQAKLDEMAALNEALDVLIQTTDMGIVFVDTELKIRKFTVAARRVLPLSPGDVGRPLYELAHNLPGVDLAEEVRAVLGGGESVSTEVQTQDGRTVLHRIYAFATGDDANRGAVLTFVDTTDVARAAHRAPRD